VVREVRVEKTRGGGEVMVIWRWIGIGVGMLGMGWGWEELEFRDED
jgi:hypothetical protein